MASGSNDLYSIEKLRWSDPIKVYTRKHSRTLKNDTNTGAENNNNNVSRPSSPRNTEAEEAKLAEQSQEQRGRHEPEFALPQLHDSSARDLERDGGTGSEQVTVIYGGEVVQEGSGEPADRICGEDVADEGGDSPIVEANGCSQPRVHPDVASSQLQDSLACRFTRKGDTDSERVTVINGGEVRGGSGEPGLGLSGNNVAGEGGNSPIVETNGCIQPRVHPDVANGLVKPVISRFQDRILINLTGARSRDEIEDLRRTLENELDQVRSLVNKLEDKEVQLTQYNTSTNGSIIIKNTVNIAAVPSGVVESYSRRQYIGNDVIKSRSLVRGNSDVGSVGHPESRPPFRPPSVAVVENNHGAGEYVEKEKRTPKANQYYRNSEFLLDKDRLPPESNKRLKPNGFGKKQSGRSEYGFTFEFGFGFNKHQNQLLRSCSNLLQKLMKHKHGWVFNKPVNASALGLLDYHDIIKHPMDLGTIKDRLSHNWYKSPREFAEDVRLVFRNAMTYNPKGQDVHVMAEQLSMIFEERWAVIEAEYNPNWRYQMYHEAALTTPTSRKVPHPPFLHGHVRTLDRSESMTGTADSKSKPSHFAPVRRIPVPKKPKANDLNKRDMTFEEKQRLSTNLQNLPSEKLDAIVQIIKKRNSALSQHDDEIEVDIDSVDAETLWELDRFVMNHKKSLSKKKRRAELAIQARAGAAQAAPVMNSAPFAVGALKESKTGDTRAPATNVEGGRHVDNASSSSSSSSSSSDSGSSSSDSDSDNSSANGS